MLDEEVWKRAEPASDFVQSEPLEGQPATEKTEVRVAYDADNLYIAAKLFDANVAGLVVNDIKKDFKEEDQDDFEVLLDTFGDRRNGYVFSTNIEGARHDRQVALEGREINQSWDAVWDVRTRVASDGWTVEMRIPFRALRFDPVNQRAWGVNFSRHIRRKNEVVFWSPVSRVSRSRRQTTRWATLPVSISASSSCIAGRSRFFPEKPSSDKYWIGPSSWIFAYWPHRILCASGEWSI